VRIEVDPLNTQHAQHRPVRRPDPSCWPWATPVKDFDMADEPRMRVLSSCPLRCSHSGTNRRKGGGSLGTDFSSACAPGSPATYVLVLGLTSGSPVPCGVSVGKGDVLGWARLARAGPRHFPLFVLAGLVLPSSRSRVQACSKSLLCYNFSGVSPQRTYLVTVC